MFSFSTKTQVNKELKIKDVLRQIGADKDIKTEAQSIKSLSLTNILNENTINCERDEKYKEIYHRELLTENNIRIKAITQWVYR